MKQKPSERILEIARLSKLPQQNDTQEIWKMILALMEYLDEAQEKEGV